jgi:hypothetical protein
MLGLMKKAARRRILLAEGSDWIHFKVNASRWNSVVFHLLGVRHRAQRVLLLEGTVMRIECSCGGQSEFRRQFDGTAEVMHATCKRWLYVQRVQRSQLPRAVARERDP